MRSSRTGSKWDRSIDESGAYSSSEEDDERARLKKPHGSSGGGGGCGVYGRSSEVTSPIESDNTYAEANLLQTDKGMDLSDSEVYEGSNGSINHRYQPPHQNILRSPHREPHRFLGGRSNSSQDNKSQFYGTGSRGVVSSRTSTNLPIRRATNGPLPDPPNTSTRRGGQLVITPDRNWGNGEPLGMAETRLGNREDYGLKYGTSLHLAHQSQPKGSRNQTQQQSLVSSSGGSSSSTTKASSLHRRSLSDDSLSIDKHINPNSSGGSTSTAVITSASNPVNEESLHQHHQLTMDPIVMPGFPVRTLQGHPPPPYSPSREKFRIGKKCSFHCSWKLVAFALTLLTLVLSSVIAYFGAVKYPSHSPLRDVIISEDCITSDPPLSVLSVEKQQMQQADSNILNYPSRSRPVTITISPGRPYEALIDPMTFWRSRLPVHRPGNFRLNLTFSPESSSSSKDLAIYGKARFPPSVTNYDWIHIVSNGELRIPDIYSLRSKRSPSSSGSSPIISISESFPLGDMFLAVLNDGLSPVGIRISLFEDTSGSSSIMLGSESTSRKTSEESSISLCLNDCSGQGKCVNGNCVCNPRFSGPDCTLSVCPLLCSGNGIYRGGVCVCADGWKGLECDVLVNECKDPDCNGHGLCSPKGICICEPGWSGDSCEERDCEAKDCNGHGICRNAICHCHPGWMGNNCEKSNDALLQCLPNCSGHGIYDYTAGLCDCQESWTGSDCNITLCSLDCGRRGLCLHGSCSCEEGWTGPRCAYRICDERCASHGQCKDGKCLCQRGWNGKHCSLNGCGPEGKCNDRGNCDVNMNGEYECKCYPGWTGRYCEYHDETDCEDGIDNDENGLTDCADSRCCSHPSCRKNIMCVYSADPVEVLSGKDHGSYLYESGSSFFERVQFLFEGQKSVQSYAKNDAFDPMRASIIRGRVITSQGQGIIGVRVSVDRVKEASNYGFTLTRPEGWFDMVVNGGGAVTLQFQRSPLKAMTRTTYIPWNRIVVINPVVMTSYGGMGISRDEEDTSLQVSYFEPCQAHDYEKVKPKVFSSYFSQYTAPTSGHLSPEIQAFREKIQVPHTNLNLVYSSSSAPGYKSLIHVCLTPSLIAESLDNITLKITVAGTVFRKTFEADPNLNYKFAWNKRNSYKQIVYGVTEAEVSVGYHYDDCLHTIWDTRTIKVRAQESPISNIGGWNLDIHHHFNRHQGILEKGDGSFNEFNHRRIDSIIGGSGMEKRPFVCHPKSICEQSLANQSFLYDVISMSTGPDGSLYVGDYNVIRRINPDGSVISLLYLGDKDRKYIYDLKISPADNKLYMAHAESYQIFIIEDLTGNANPYNNSVVVAGTGKRCLPGDRDICGDGGNALKARFSYPKGLAVSVDKTIYISDGQNIRLISSEGEISTLIGHHRRREGPPNPLQCQNTYIASQIQLQWPTKLELNPLDSSLHIVDDTMILRLTPDLRVVVVAGASSLCSSPRRKLFGPISDISFSSNNGNLYVSSGGIVYIINSDGSIDHFISSSKRNCICPEIALDECSEFCIRAITSMTIDGHSLYISDSMKILRVKKLFQEEPKNIKVNDPVSGEIYTFNSVGQHLSTVYCETGSIKAAFKYKKANNDHHLFEVRNAMDKSILSLERGYSSQISSLTTGVGKKITLKMSSREQLLIEFWKNDRNAITFEYNAGEGLLKSSRTNDGDFLFISNNEEGRVSEIISSTGESVRIDECTETGMNLPSLDICYALRRNGLHIKSITLNKNELTISRKGSNDLKILIGVESAAIKKKDNAEFYITSSLGSMKNGDIFSSGIPISMAQREGKLSIRTFDWELSRNSRGKSKKLNLSGKTVLDVRYLETNEQGSIEEHISKGNGLIVMKIVYNEAFRPTSWSSTSGKNCTRGYDSLNRLTENRCGRIRECLVYDSGTGYIKEKSNCENRLGIKYFYSMPLNKPTSVELPLGSVYTYDYDEYGGLAGIRLPKSDSTYKFKSQVHFGGKIKYYHYLPGLQEPYVYYQSSSGLLLEIRPPTGNGVSLFKYDVNYQIVETISADVQIYYKRRSGILHRIEMHYTGEERFSIKEIFHKTGHTSLQKRLYFSSNSGFASATFRYDKSSLSGHIGGKNITETWENGVEIVWDKIPQDRNPGEFIVTHLNLNETLVTDGVAYYSRADNFLILEIHGREYFRASYKFDDSNQLSSVEITNYNRRSKETVQNYQYDSEGRLLRNNDLEWQYDGDLGNLIKTSSRSKWKKKKVKHFRYKPGTYMRSDLEYDDSGRVIFNGRIKFTYNIIAGNDCIKRAVLNDIIIEYFYDQNGRLIGRKVNDKVTQFFYAYPDFTNLVSHIYEPDSGSLIHLKYDDQRNLIFVNINGKKYYVINDFSKSPILYFSINGGRAVKVIREIHRSPFGVVLSDTNPNFRIPIDFKGGIKDYDTGLVHLQDDKSGNCRLYDPKSSSYYTPRWKSVIEYPYEPISLNLYSYNRYNPLRKESHSRGDIFSNLKDTLRNSEDMLSKETLLANGLFFANGPLFSPTSAETEFQKRMNQIFALSYFENQLPSGNDVRISRTDSALGRFVAFDPSSSQVYSVSDGTLNQVQRSVFTQVLEGAKLVEFKTVPRDDDMLFFTKPKIRPDDITALRRLGPSVNLTIHESQTSEKEIKFLDVKVHLADTILNIRYGTSPESEKARLLRHAYKTISRKIWLKERTSGRWSPRDMQSLLSQGFVSGFITQYRLKNIEKYPELSTDLNNIEIVHESVKMLQK